MSISSVLISGALIGVGSSLSGAASVAAPKLAEFLPAGYRVTAVKDVNLDESAVKQEAITAVGPTNSSGFATSLVLVLAWDSYAKRWTSVYDTLHLASWQATSQFGKGPGLLNATDQGPRLEVIHNQPDGRADLLYWLNSIAGNTNYLIVGVVHFQNQIATQAYSFGQSFGHVSSMDQVSKAQPGALVFGNEPNQEIKITLPWLTSVDSQSSAARMYYFTVAAQTKDYDYYQQVYDSRSYVGVGLNNVSEVEYVDPQSPANGKLHVGDVIQSVVESTPTKDMTYLLGPKVVEEVALYLPGDVITLRVRRAGQTISVPLKLAQWPIDQTLNYVQTSTGEYDIM